MTSATILFDLDGALIDSIELIVRSYQHTARAQARGACKNEEQRRFWLLPQPEVVQCLGSVLGYVPEQYGFDLHGTIPLSNHVIPPLARRGPPPPHPPAPCERAHPRSAGSFHPARSKNT